MIFLYFMISAIVFLLLANYLYKRIVLYNTQEEQIRRASRKKNAYEIASFGSSYARYAFDFSDTTLMGANFGLLPQFLYYTEKMIIDYRKSYKNNALIIIVLPALIFAREGKGLYGAERYINLLSKKALGDEFSIKKYITQKLFPLLVPTKQNIRRVLRNILNYRKDAAEYNQIVNVLSEAEVKKSAKQRCNDWIKEFGLIDTKTASCMDHLESEFLKSREVLSHIIEYCISEGLRPVLVVTPISTEMKEELSDAFLDKVLYNNIRMANTANVPFLDYLTDSRFTDRTNYSGNADFLNARARKEFSQIVINDAIAAYSRYDK